MALLPPLSAVDSVEQRFFSAQPDPALEDTLFYAIGVELVHRGLSSTRTEGEGAYILQTNYAQQGNSLSLSFQFFISTGAVQDLVALDALVALDDTFNAQVGAAIHQLIARAKLPDQPNDTSHIEGVFPGADPGSPEASGEPELGQDSPKDPGQAGAPLNGAGHGQAVQAVLVADLGLEGTAFFGKISQFTNYGVGASLKAALAWRGEDIGLQLGLLATNINAINNTGISGGPLYCNGLALALDLGTGSRQSYRVNGTLAGGVMLLTMGSLAYSKPAPWLQGGASIALPIGAGFFLGGRVQAQVIFETTLIVGLSIGFTVGKEF